MDSLDYKYRNSSLVKLNLNSEPSKVLKRLFSEILLVLVMVCHVRYANVRITVHAHFVGEYSLRPEFFLSEGNITMVRGPDMGIFQVKKYQNDLWCVI